MTKDTEFDTDTWELSTAHITLIVIVSALLTLAYWSGLKEMVRIWNNSEEYGYGFIIPAITFFFIWQKRSELMKFEFKGSWHGIVLLMLGLAFLVIGELATLYIVIQYAYMITLFGLALTIIGTKGFSVIFPALALLIFMIPLPNFLYQTLSAQLQLISSALGVLVIRLFGISVYLEGNVIDLGTYQLQVVEACSGLRYLFPLTALSYIAAYIYKGAFWKKALIFLSSAPITVLMNSFRIGVIGVLVEYWGIEQAEGFLHDFEGWIVFMACMAILVIEMWVLSKFGKDKAPFSEVFEIALPSLPEGIRKKRVITNPFRLTIPIALASAILPLSLLDRQEVIPERNALYSFPLEIENWKGVRDTLEQYYIDVLQFDDYILATYTNEYKDAVNLYIAYYESQRKGASIHSPRSCIPGGGWQIKEHTVKRLNHEEVGEIDVNRVLIQNHTNRQLVYYWFDQRGRNLTSEYAVKWYLFLDALSKNRTDGALIRLTTPLDPTEDVRVADERLQEFVAHALVNVGPYLPAP